MEGSRLRSQHPDDASNQAVLALLPKSGTTITLTD